MTLGAALPMLFLLALPRGVSPDDVAPDYRAKAYDLKGGDHIYTELHFETVRDGKHIGSRVLYTRPGGEVIASKSIVFEDDALSPSFELQDLRDGYREGADGAGDGRIRLFVQRAEDKPVQASRVDVPSAAVIDAGFDKFIRRSWDRLLTGETMTFDFAVPSEQRFFRFRVRRTETDRVDGREVARLRMEIGNRLLRFLVDPIDLTYDLENRRLLVFEGISNLNNEVGKSHNARIVFEYPDLDGSPPGVSASVSP